MTAATKTTAVANTNSSRFKSTSVAASLPTVTLDTTLAQLYRHCRSLKDKHIGQVLSGFSAATSLTKHIPRNRKYIYQDGPFTSGDTTDESQERMTVKYLSLVTQRDAFFSGDSSSIFFHISADPERRAYDRNEVEKTLQVLPNTQRPNLVFCNGPEDIPVSKFGIDKVACKVMLDGLESYPHVVPWETHWFLNSKAALASSGLPTPKSEAIGVRGFPAEPDACCDHCRGLELDDYIIPEACQGPRRQWIEKHIKRLMGELETRPLPFILKNQETFGGAGTYFVRTEKERQEVSGSMRNGLLRRLLSSVNASNVHLNPATLLFSEVVQNVVGDYGLTFFVPDAGQECIYLGASQQIIEDSTSWIGSTIDYRGQDALRTKFEPLVHQISAWLQAHSYIGPAGADVLETQDGRVHIVDLNVRTTGSACLPLLRSHFTQRGLGWASSFSINLSWRRSNFIQAFQGEFERGQICIMSWYEDKETGDSLADVVVGGKDESELKNLSERVRKMSAPVTF